MMHQQNTKNLIWFILFLFWVTFSYAQETFPVNGTRNTSLKTYAFKNATIVAGPEEFIFNGTMVIQQNRIIAIGSGITIPEGAVIYDVKGKFIYPSFIELYSNYGMPKQIKKKEGNRKPQYEKTRKGVGGWNDAFHPEVNSIHHFDPNEKQAQELRKLGFGATVTHVTDGIARGTGAVVSLNKDKSNNVILKEQAASFYAFKKGTSKQKYPSSLMGSIALIRQNYYDAQWYAQLENPKYHDASLKALTDQLNLPKIFSVTDYQSALRADKVGDEFGQQFIIKGSGDEYKRIDAIKQTGASFILPLEFPKPYDVEDPFDAMYVSTSKMKHWELAPSNPTKMVRAGIPIAFTTDKLKNKSKLMHHIRLAMQYGLTESQALDALTLAPAKMIGVENELGSLAVGKRANFLITSGPIFEANTVLYENWIEGVPYRLKDKDVPLISGEYNLNIDGNLFVLKVEEKAGKQKAIISRNETDFPVRLKQEGGLVSIIAEKDLSPFKAPFRLSGKINFEGKIWDGKAQDVDGKWYDWSAIRQKEEVQELTKTKNTKETGDVYYPNNGFGNIELPVSQNFFIDNIRIWTCDSGGVFTGDVLIRNGKIEAVDRILENTDGFERIDGKGKHLTPGIVDEHSHIAISRGVNEGTHSSSAEVRIGDVVNPDDIDIYRQLAGGVTTAQLLHGSANPIGGQSALIKLKWGYDAEMMKIPNAPGFIKFALGENVKQSNWGDNEKVRFPQTRMGVEQVYYDAFIRAKKYAQNREAYDTEEAKFKLPLISKPNPHSIPRKDLALDALVEILDSTRFITCHSYVQSEINMLMHVGDSMGFRVNTFTHILEGYKIADKLKVHGAAGSTFADWWAYKFEVNDAIPYNAALLNRMGVLTGINSDDAEMGRRLNQEAAKTIKYGGVSEEEALKMITINPAKMLHLDDRIGSITVGKDADVVIWDNNPLSVYARPEMTLIEGTVFYSKEKDQEARGRNQQERKRLMAKMLEAKKNGEPTLKVQKEEKHHYHCDTIDEEY